ncbi:MAG: DUF2085 domain-containing protein [Vicinamibacterales bacterium]
MLLAWALAAASVLWMVLLTLTAAGSSGVPAVIGDSVFRLSSFICHQQPERSYHWGAAAWPVCARCLGLYAAAPVGAFLAIALGRPHDIPAPSRNFWLLCSAGMPTAATWLAEHLAGVSMTNDVRFAAALPLGAAVAWLAVRVVSATARPRVSQYTLQDARRGQAR